jgi:hypothetical protein
MGLLWAILDGSGPLLLEEPELSLHPSVIRYIPAIFSRIQRRGRRQILVSTHSQDLFRDEGIGLDEVFLLLTGREGTTVRPASEFDDVKAMLEGGLPLPEAIMPKTQPENVQQLALFGCALPGRTRVNTGKRKGRGPSKAPIKSTVLWGYCPRMIDALEGQHRPLETKAFEKLMPLSASSERVWGMYVRSSLRMSSARMKTMLGLALSAWAPVGMLPESPKESRTTKATEANGRTIFLAPGTPHEWGKRDRRSAPCPYLP